MNFLGNLVLLAQDQAIKVAAPAAATSYDWKLMALLIGAFVLPVIFGTVIARTLRVKEYTGRITVTLFILAMSLVPFLSELAHGRPMSEAVTWGIDLAGGTNMVFAVDEAAANATGKKITPEVMSKIEESVRKRINPSGVEEVTVRKVGQNRIEIIIPGADPEKAQQIKERITNLGELEFALLANDVENRDLLDLARKPENANKTELYNDKGDLVAKWRRSAQGKDGSWKVALASIEDPRADFRDGVMRERDIDGKPVREILVVNETDPTKVINGRDHLQSAAPALSTSGPSVSFRFNTVGGTRFGRLTAAHLPNESTNFFSHLAILLNDEVHSAPRINSVISENGEITGNFTQAETEELASVLNAGALDAPLIKQPINEYTVSPLLGIDIQQKGLRAIVIAVIGVIAVTAIYYMAAGVIADICLILNLIILLGAMAVIDATFTLPGLAGIALTLGMAIDANVLIYERMREELAKGASFRMCIKNGFDKALPTILDSNLTTMITAVVLYYIGTDQVKGFAVTLFIGLAISMFCAVYVGRLIFDICEKKKWITQLKMMNLITAKNVDFVGKRGMFIGASMILLVAGLLVIGYRGRENMDIDFRGGSMVTFQFAEGQKPKVEEVIGTIQPKFEDTISLEQLTLPGKDNQDQVLYRLRTIVDNPVETRDRLRDAFSQGKYHLILQSFATGEVKPIPAPKEATDKPDPFAGGHEFEVTMGQPLSATSMTGEFESAMQASNPEKYGQPRDLFDVVNPGGGDTDAVEKLVIRTRPSVPVEDVTKASQALVTRLDKQPVFDEVNTFAGQVAADTQVSALLAIFFSLVATTFYLWFRFNGVTFGLAAAVACFHDVLITLGIMAAASYLGATTFGQSLGLQDFKANLTIIAAVLTVIGYSLNDTIVVFDRIREVRGKNPLVTYEMVNRSLNETLPRTLLTSSTTLVVLFVLYFIGGESVRGFSFCLILGILIGTYSSIYVASPVLVWIMNREQKKRPILS
jgi:SecD/SecF fusion protein